MQILVGDIGGTNTRLAMGVLRDGRICIEQRENFASADYASLTEVVHHYAPAGQTTLSAAAFGVAGPVNQGVSRITNLPWEISQSNLAEQLRLPNVALINDLEAQAWGLDALDSGELLTLHTGTGPATGNRAIVAAGTGLGEAGLCATGAGYHPFATEGGHTDFAAINERDWLLRQYLHERHDHVSWERVLSGPGLVALYQFLLRQHRAPAPDWLTAPGKVPAAHITDLALGQQDAICVETLQWFVQLYGREAGNIALKLKATGGVFLGGGIAPRILPALQDGEFVEAYLDKGRMRALLERIPVRVICSDLVALKGLTRLALGATDQRAT